jgi:chromate transporter
MDATIIQVFLLFAKLGLLSFGGGTAILAEMQRESVGRGWLTDAEFVQAYAIGQMTPGPGTLFVIPVGYQAAGIPGAVAAAIGFFLPTGLVAFAAICLWSRLRRSPWPAAIRDALLPIAIGLSFASAYSMGRAGLTDVASLFIAGASALLIWRTPIPTPVVLLLGGGAGVLSTVVQIH